MSLLYPALRFCGISDSVNIITQSFRFNQPQKSILQLTMIQHLSTAPASEMYQFLGAFIISSFQIDFRSFVTNILSVSFGREWILAQKLKPNSKITLKMLRNFGLSRTIHSSVHPKNILIYVQLNKKDFFYVIRTSYVLISTSNYNNIQIWTNRQYLSSASPI